MRPDVIVGLVGSHACFPRPDCPDPDERFMRLALREAERGRGQTSPNPAVGAVIVKNGRVLARGFHHRAGQPHAEIEALQALGSESRARGATIYVTLEPCSTHGRTPPCTEAIRRAGFARVVIGATDPNPRHAGKAVAILEAAGIVVRPGILSAECAALNPAFNRWIVTGRPWVIAKAALTLDGRLTRPPGEDRWLSGPAARAAGHRLRAQVDAILIGAGTLRADNPRLTVRGVPGADPQRQPWRVVLTRGGRFTGECSFVYGPMAGANARLPPTHVAAGTGGPRRTRGHERLDRRGRTGARAGV